MNNKTIVIVALIAVVIVGLTLYFRSGDSELDSTNNSSGLIVGKNAIYAAEQLPGNSVIISVARLEKPGFVVIHEDNAGTPGNILGVSNLLQEGETRDLPAIQLSRTTEDGEDIYAMLHLDDGDGIFDAVKDLPALDSTTNSPVMTTVTISKEAVEAEGEVNL